MPAIRRTSGASFSMTVDVEDWFHSENVKKGAPRNVWDDCELRVERNTMRILQIMEDNATRATFFVLGWIAERCPSLVQTIAAAGHEIASHGYGHELVYSVTPERFREDVKRSKHMLEDMTGRAVLGYRAPCFSITDWAMSILSEVGYVYDSSIVPTVGHDRYSRIDGVTTDRPVFVTPDGMKEVCVSCLPIGARGIPWGGGGYFRLMPYRAWRMGMRSIAARGLPYVFYLHPWDLDAGQPHVAGINAANRIRQRIGVHGCESKLARLIADFEWRPIAEILDTFDETVTPSIEQVGPRLPC